MAVPDEELDGDRLIAEAARLRDDRARATIAEAASKLGRPDAARRLAEELLALATAR